MSLNIEATVKTPKIIFDSEGGIISLSGISIPEDPQEFFQPLDLELNSYVISPSANTLLEFKLEYFNTSTTLIIRNLIRRLHEASSKTKLQVKWFYESDDEDMEEAGGEFKMLFNDIQFDIIGVDKL